MQVINLFGGPGTGKSTTAADLFATMKWDNRNVELVDEYAKQITWDDRKSILNDQLYMTAKQNRKLARLQPHVDWVITDSPLILALAYVPSDYFVSFKPMLVELFNSYDNINIMLTRKKPFHQVGRMQTEDEARMADTSIRNILNQMEYPYFEVDADQDAKNVIYDIIRGRGRV